MTVVAVSGQARSSTITAQDTALRLNDATSTSCGVLARLLNGCVTTPTTSATSAGSSGATQPGTAPTSPATSSATTTSTTSQSSTAGASTTPPSDASTSASSTSDCAGTTPPVAAPSGSWTCTLDDEFNGTSLDTTKWQPQLTANSGYTTGSFNAKVCYVNTPQTIDESGGYLNLTLVRLTKLTSCPGLNFFGSPTHYEGGMVTSYKLFSQEYGYFQVSAEMPAATVKGLQETLWLYPLNQKLYGKWPDSGEIDYGEYYSNLPGKDYPILHYPGSGRDPNSQITTGCTFTGASPEGQFNTYALSWTPTTLTAYFNGTACITDNYSNYVASPDKAPEPFNQPFFLSFTAALGMGTNGATTSTPMPSTTKIDWVRVWQYGSS